MKRVLILLVLSQVRQLLEASVAKDPKVGRIFAPGETARCFNVWTATPVGWSLDRKGASRDPGQALARACGRHLVDAGRKMMRFFGALALRLLADSLENGKIAADFRRNDDRKCR